MCCDTGANILISLVLMSILILVFLSTDDINDIKMFSERSQISKIDLFVKKANGFHP